MTQREASDVRMRIQVVASILKQLKTDVDLSSDARLPDVIAHYEAQKEKLEKELADIEQPPPIVIGLKAASLSGKVPNLKE